MSELITIHDPIQIGVLGLNFGGGIARHIAKTVPCLNIRGVCDVNNDKCQQLATELGVKSYQKLNDMLLDDEIEAIAVFTGPVGRAKLISHILRADRHILTTKPFELDAADSSRVLEEAKKRGLIIQLNSPGPGPAQDIVTIHKWAKEYDLGRPVAFRAETWTRYHEQRNGTWYDDPQQCSVAPILRLGVYFLNEFASLFGTPSEVHVIQSRLFTERPTSDHAQLSISYKNGAMGFVFASFCIEDGQPFRDHVTLNFERGTVRRWVERDSPTTDLSGDIAVVELRKKDTPVIQFRTDPGAFCGWYQWHTFWKDIRGGYAMTADDIRSVQYGVNIIDAMRVSAETGSPAAVRTW